MTSGADRLALRRALEARWPPLLHGAWRILFLCSVVWAMVAMALWLAMLAGLVSLPIAGDPVAWHRHELLFGSIGATLAGYLLSTTPNRSGTLPAIGGRLLALAGVWAAARLAGLMTGIIGPWPAMAGDALFFGALVASCLREQHDAARPALKPAHVSTGLALAFGVAAVADHLLESAVPTQAAGVVMALLISHVGGILLPSFIRTAATRTVRAALPGQPRSFDHAATAITALALGVALFRPGPWASALLVAAAAAQGWRLRRWRPLAARRHPPTLAMALGFAWLPAALLMIAAWGMTSDTIHALTAGAISAMSLAVMARLAERFSGSAPRLPGASLVAVALVSCGALARTFGPDLASLIDTPIDTHQIAGLLWAGGQLVWLFAYGPLLVNGRPSGAADRAGRSA